MTTLLANGNLLIASTVEGHIHHDRALTWFETVEPHLATCPITEGTLLRFLIREGQPAADAIAVLEAIRAQDWHHFWPDEIGYERDHLAGVIGHRQVTDAYLVALARHHHGRLATLDKGLAALHGTAALLLG